MNTTLLLLTLLADPSPKYTIDDVLLDRIDQKRMEAIARCEESIKREPSIKYNSRDAYLNGRKSLAETKRQLKALREFKTLTLPPMGIEKNQPGTLGNQRVFQVIDSENMILEYARSSMVPVASNNRVSYRRSQSVDHVWLIGHNTADLADGAEERFDGVYVITGTKQYESARGSQRTAFTVERIDLDSGEVLRMLKARYHSRKK